SMLLVSAPDTCFLPPALAGDGKVWGPAVQLYAVRSRRNWGIGDFTDLYRIVEECGHAGASLIGLNPLHALFPHNPLHASPYSPSSRQFLNILYIDVEAIPEFAECEPARQKVAESAFQARLQALRAAESVDYLGVAAMKQPILEELYEYFRAGHAARNTDRARAFTLYREQQGEGLYRHALYEALQDYFHTRDSAIWGWLVWPEAYRDPRSPEVGRFAEEHRNRIEYFQYLQWQADSQLAACGRLSMERRLGVGLYQDLAISVDRAGAEVWGNQSLYVARASIGAPPDDFNLNGQNWGLPPWNPDELRESAYAAFIATLRANMRHSGALRIDHVMGLMRLFWVPEEGGPADGTYVQYPFDDLLGILALESQRNQCLVVGEDLGTVPEEVRTKLAALGVLSYRLLYFEKDEKGDFRLPATYPAQALVAVSTHDLPTLAGFWHGDDLSERAALNHFPSDADRDRQVITRAEDRARLLLALDREKLLPAGLTVHPVSSPEMTPELARAIHDYLAHAPSKIMLVQLEDVFGQRRQINLPGTSLERPNWRYRLVLDIEDLPQDARWRELAAVLRAHRAPARAPARQRPAATIPTATYRLQFHRDFSFNQAAAIVPYLHRLGISHCYASPYLKARAGSHHGYDIVDHNSLNPEVGSVMDFDHFVRTLHEHGMGQILDIVPNHMGVGGDDNHWWMDVLENGQSSAFADFFDIDWQPPKEDLRGKVLCPVLGDHYGKLLESGELRLVFEAEQGTLAVRYYNHRFPIDPRTYPLILHHDQARLERKMGEEHPLLSDYESLVTALRNLPERSQTYEARVKERRRDKEAHKRRLAQLVREHTDIRQFVEENVATFNGAGTEAGRFDLLHQLLEAQAFRLSYWRVASDEINYRRFFDINDLAGLRTENPEVFDATHRLIFDMIGRGQVDGLRIDHPDGLYDPAQYYERLERRLLSLAEDSPSADPAKPAPTAGNPAMYVVAEKILASHERLPENWRVHGTTGYDFTNLVNGLFVYGPAEREIDRIYRRFAGNQPDFDDLLYECKKLVMRTALSSELHVLANYLDRISESDRHTRDFTHTAQRTALFEVVACFPVYRTYVTSECVTDEDRRYVDWAIAAAKRRSTAADVTIFDFIRRILLLEDLEGRSERYKRAVVEFAMRFQQFTSPVMAKGMEDTLFYQYNRLVSLNEVGADLRRFAVSPAAFHYANQERQRRWPNAMLCTSTHDTKRSEDVRARLNVLSEIPGEWREHLARWSRINRSRKRRLTDGWAPSQNDEYLLYQTLLGMWPPGRLDDALLGSVRERAEAYMLKAIREAKVHTSWINRNQDYEEGVCAFVQALLGTTEHNLFLEDFLTLQRRIAPLGWYNGLSQTLLKLTSPGVPDFYQGTELFELSLVDPDNRRPVDHAARLRLLDEVIGLAQTDNKKRPGKVCDLLRNPEDGRAKLYLIWRVLMLRRHHPRWFAAGDYLPLGAEGARSEHLCAFARLQDEQAIITVVPRWFSRLVSDKHPLPLGPDVWADTLIETPPGGHDYINVFTGEPVRVQERKGKVFFAVSSLLANFPVAMLAPKDISK
ncbi:MAG: malto-oligosyltrehalose synthase, partial [Gammaproteobacteria bacterium]|nr:malto-oligosyltrehalose synthase [Gammaproteobacteria bacterium]